MGDEDKTHLILLFQPLHQAHQLCLDGHIEGTGHLVANENSWLDEQGITVQLLESAKDDYTKELLAATPRLQKGATDGDHFDL